MINLRYHIVSLTAVFLAIGIGLTLGSTFLDRATVENLNGQLESLEQRLEERNTEIDELRSDLDTAEALQEALDEQGVGLLADRLDPVPVLVVASEGVDQDDVEGAVRSLEIAGADVQGLWWLSERFLLGSDADIADLATALDVGSEDPARLRRLAVAALAEAIRQRQAAGSEVEPAGSEVEPAEPATGPEEPASGQVPAVEGDGTAGEAPADETTGGPGDEADPGPATDPAAGTLADFPDVQGLLDAGFVVFEPVADGPEAARLAPGVRVVLVGGSAGVPDDVVLRPLLEQMAEGVDEPMPTIVTSALGEDGQVSEVVATTRADERLRSTVSTVDDIERFPGWMATVLAIEDLADGVVGHYGLGDGASSLLPALQAP